jgi:hypothetical protein
MEFPNNSGRSREKRIPSFGPFYAKYRDVILFNKNIIIAAIASVIADALVVQYAFEAIGNDIIVSIFSIITDTGVYLATFAGVFMIDNRNRYLDQAIGKRDSAKFKSDMKKIVATLGVSEVVYIIVKFTSIYALLQSGIAPPYQIAIFTTLLAWMFYIVTANVMIRWQRLFK